MNTHNTNNKDIGSSSGSWNYSMDKLSFPTFNTTRMQMELTESGKISTDARETVTQEQHVSRPLGSNALDIQDAVATVKSVTEHKHVDSKILHTSSDGLLPTIKNYLAKPCIVSSGTLTTGDLPSSFTKYATTYPLTYAKAYRDKISASLTMRYTTVITLQINGTRFQQGLYKLCFLPTGGMLRDPSETGQLNRYLRDHAANRSQISQLLSADFYINSDTSVQLRVPFISAFPGATIVHDPNVPVIGDPGVFFIYPYSPLVAVEGNTSATYTLWVHYEDVEILGNTAPTSAPITMQGNFTRRLQKKKNVDIMEAETHQNGPISAPLQIISEASGTLAKIPLLSGYAGPLSWATAAASHAASAFGWSRPLQLDSLSRMKNMYLNYLPNSDQKDDSTPLSLLSTNHINVLPGFSGTDVDEMSIDYFKSIPGLFRVDSWTNQNAQGALLYSIKIAPGEFRYTGAGTISGHTNFTPVGMLSTMFSQYTGGFDIHMKFVKTEFHSGRLLAVFNPYESTTSTENYTFADTMYLNKTIIDIRDTNEITIRVPYVSAIPWRPTTRTLNYGSVYGSLKIYVLDVLVAPETVSPDITIFSEVSGADDLRFSVPRPNFWVRPAIASYQMNMDKDSKLDSISHDYIGDKVNADTDYTKEEACIGESIDSLRQLLKRGGLCLYNNSTANLTTMNFNPFLNNISEKSAPDEFDIPRDPYALLSSFYCLQRGGMRLKWISDNDLGATYYCYDKDRSAILKTRMVDYTANDPSQSSLSMPNSQFGMEKNAQGGFSVTVPFYHYTHSTPTGSNVTSTTTPVINTAASGSNANVLRVIFTQPIAQKSLILHRSGADDCNFGGFVSIPPLAPAVTTFPVPP